SSCLRMVLAFSTPFSSANETSSAGVLDLRSWSLISRMGWSCGGLLRRGTGRLQEKRTRKKRSASSKQGKRLMKGFKPDAAAGSNRNATTSACVGWDELNIEKRLGFRKQRKSHTSPEVRSRERFDDHEDDDQDHQDRRHFI